MPEPEGAAAPDIRPTLLLVEDEDSVRRLFCAVLESAGYRVLLAAGPHEAIAMARNHDRPLDLLITDVIMPDMDGPSMAAAIVALHPGCPVLLISGYPSDATAVGGGAGAASYLQKPFTPRALVARVREMLQPRP